MSRVRPTLVAIGLLAVAATTPSAIAAAATPTLHTDRRCYQVGQSVTVTGAGFAPSSVFDIAVDDVDFGQSLTSATGGFTSALIPGGLRAGYVQSIDELNASDGVREVVSHFTLTRPTGAQFSGGTSLSKQAPLAVWDFAPVGRPVSVYLHYVRAGHSASDTQALGRTQGQCGSLRTSKRRLFPFAPALGTWMLQFDTSRAYLSSPGGPVARLTVHVH